jgi:hypothetical protein
VQNYGWRRSAPDLPCPVVAAIFNLNHHATYVHWHFINVSLSNVLVVAVMLAVFVLAIVLPFPGHRGARGE